MTDDMQIGELLADQLQRLFSRNVDSHRLIAIESGERIDNLWNELYAQGATFALAGGEVGAGLSWQQCLPMLRTLGWYGAPVPLAETLQAAAALEAAGIDIPEGPLAISTAQYIWDDEGCITGADTLVPWLPQSHSMVGVATALDGTTHLFLISVDTMTLTKVDSLGRIPSASVCLDRLPVNASALVDGIDLLSDMAISRAAMISGILDRILSITVEYANTRKQFGRSIGKFQAIQQHLATIAMQTALSQAAVNFACQQRDQGNGARGAAIGKICTSRAATLSAQAAHQVFGAIGVTEEHELQLLTRRLWQWRGEAGSDHYWSETLGAELIADGGDALWSHIADPVEISG